SSTTFKDTAGYGWAVPYLAILQQKGIMKGDGYGNAMPGRTISPNEAVTMVLRAIGYTDNASVLVGQWPANYVSLGQSLNLYEKVSSDLQVTKASSAQMIYNALTVQLVQVDANSTVKLLYDAGIGVEETLLTTGLNCYRDPAPGTGDKKIVTLADAAASKINLIPKIGAYGVLYRSNVDDEVVALTKVETKFLAGRFMYNKSNGKIDCFQAVDGTKYTLSASTGNRISPSAWAQQFNTVDSDLNSVPSGSAIFFNAKQISSLTNEECDNYLFYNNTLSGVRVLDNQAAYLTVAAKVSGLTITDLRSVLIWSANDNFLYASDQIDGKKFNSHDFPLDVNNERDDYGYVLDGVNNLDDIATDNVVYIYKHPDSKKIVRIAVGTETQSGTVTNVNIPDSTRTIGGKTLIVAPYNYKRGEVDKVGNEGTALLDVYNRIYSFKLGEASRGNYAVIIKAASYFNEQVKIFDKTGKEVIYDIGKNTSQTTLNGLQASGHSLIEYKLAGGKLDTVVKTSERVTKGAPTDKAPGHVNASGSILSFPKDTTKTNLLIDSGVLVYVEDGDDYTLGSIKDLLDKDIEETFQYITDDAGAVRALVVNTKDAGAQKLFVMINGAAEAWDNGAVDAVTGLSFAKGYLATSEFQGNYDGLIADLTTAGVARASSNTNGRGRYDNLVKFRVSEDGVLKAAEKVTIDASYTGLEFGEFNESGSDGTFSIRTTVGGVSVHVAFEAKAVLYKVGSDGKWAAYRPNASNFKDDDATPDRYTFLKTDDKKAHDVIIKTQ
ncbi:MAG: S-layer homology domain-containing protein, partial [Clostridiales Family XIII bacterium]|nr:S-layer homology domain-containing protein [Clostridiales Family XIII bacterium]